MVNSQKNIINLIDRLSKESKSQSRFERKSKLHFGQSNFLMGTFNMLGFYKCYPDRKISSVYFDDYNYSFVKSNINGDFYRIKPRIRWYDDNFDRSYLELKYKYGFNGFKHRDNSFINLDANFKNKLEFTKKKLLSKYNLNLFFNTKITYQRKYLKHPSGIRLTIDKNILGSINNSNINKYEFNRKEIKLPFEVIEFKYDLTLDNFFREELFPKFQNFPIRLTKCSKYVESMLTTQDV